MVQASSNGWARDPAPRSAVIAGHGPAALEAALALRHLAPDLLDVHLLTPERQFSYPSHSLLENGTGPARFDIGGLAQRMGATLHRDRMTSVSTSARRVLTAGGHELPYDWLIAAPGATTLPGIAGDGVTTFRGPKDTAAFRTVVAAAERGEFQDLVFAVPEGAGWPLSLYKLALAASSHLARRGAAGVRISLVTHEGAPVSSFGARASARIAVMLHRHGIRLRLGIRASELRDGKLSVVPSALLPAARVVTVPRHQGPRLGGLHHDRRGFIPTDAHGKVPGVQRVFAAGEATAQPIKHSAIAVRQADAAAEAVAAAAGAPVEPTPFRPELRAKPGRMVGKYLAPFLAAGEGADLPTTIYQHLRTRTFQPNREPVELALP